MFDWYQRAKEKEPRMIEIRRYLHQYPELSFEEHQTRHYIVNQLSQYSCDIRTPVGLNGIVATFKGHGDGPTIALRADFDALPIQEIKNVPYKSKNDGIMHACGHDGHTAILLAVAELLDEHRDALTGNVVLIFQYGEELNPGGAQGMIDDHCLAGVDRIYGNHLWTGYPTGAIRSRSGALMASPDEFEVTITGKGGHGAKPHDTIDPIVTMAEFILSAQKIISRTVDPVKHAVLSFGMVQAGAADNVIPESATCRGTVRTFDTDVQDHIETRMEKLLQGLAVANDITYTFDYQRSYLPVHNNHDAYNVVKTAANALNMQYSDADLLMIGEDFSHYQKVCPGAFFLTGCGNREKDTDWPHHSAYFDIDENAMKFAAATFMKILEIEGVIH